MARGYVNEGARKSWINTTDQEVKSGDIVSFKTGIAIASTNIDVGTRGILRCTGVWRLPKQKGVKLEQSSNAFFDNGLITTTGKTPAGEVWETAEAADEIVHVKIG